MPKPLLSLSYNSANQNAWVVQAPKLGAIVDGADLSLTKYMSMKDLSIFPIWMNFDAIFLFRDRILYKIENNYAFLMKKSSDYDDIHRFWSGKTEMCGAPPRLRAVHSDG